MSIWKLSAEAAKYAQVQSYATPPPPKKKEKKQNSLYLIQV